MSPNPLVLNSRENLLEILIKPESINYSIVDENEQVILRQEINTLPGKSADFVVYDHFFSQPELKILSENVTIVFENSHYQLVPSELFRENDMKLLFEMEYGKLENDQLKYLILPKWGAHLIFKAPEKLMQFLALKFPDAEIEHHVGNLLKRKIDKKSNAVWAYIRKNAIDILVVKENNLLLVNSFETMTNEDICYFVLNMYEQLQLDTETINLNLLFEKSVNEELVLLMRTYVNTINY